MKWSEKELIYLKENYPNFGVNYIRKNLNRSKSSITWKAKELKIRVKKEVKRINSNTRGNKGIFKIFHEKIININDPQIAYVLGFLWADGCFRNGNYSVTFNNLSDDVKEIINVLNSFGKWSFKENGKQIKGLIGGLDSYKYLCSLGYYNKSKISAELILNKIPSYLQHYWWRGYFDGDGCIMKNRLKHYIVFTSTIEQDWSFTNFLNIKGHIYKSICKRKDNNKINKCSQFRITNKKGTKDFCKYIYQNYELDKIGFTRKYNIYKSKYLD